MVAYIVWNAVLLGFQMGFPDMRRYVFALLVLGVLGFEARYRRLGGQRLKSGWLSRGAEPTWARVPDMGTGYHKSSLFAGECDAGHALWHVLAAMAGWCLYRYYESEAVGL